MLFLPPSPFRATRSHGRRLDRVLLPTGKVPVAIAAALAVAAAGCSSAPASPASRAQAWSTPPIATVPAGTAPPMFTQPGWTPSPTANTTAPGSAPSPVPTAESRVQPVTVPKELPRGGRAIFPRYRLVGYAGSPFSPALGRLGIGGLDARGRELKRQARPYRRNREILPVFELIATMATAFPGKGRMYRTRTDDATIRRYLAAARRNRALLLLNIQPGRADFLAEVRAYERWLREPDVGLALDPEWAVGPSQVPGRVYGRTTGVELDGVARYLSGLTRQHDLPEKALVFHQVAPSVVQSQNRLRAHPGVVMIKSVDGIGSAGAKRATWRRLVTGMPPHIQSGFKLFFQEDRRSGPLMTPAQVLALRPVPAYVMYE